MVDVENDHRYRDYWQTYWRLTDRKGVTQQLAKIEMRRRLTLIGAMLLHKGEVDGMLCGTWSTTAMHLQYIDQVIGKRPGVQTYACMNSLILPGRQVFLVDTHVNYDPSAAAGRDHHPGRRGDDALRYRAQGGAAVAQQLRLSCPVGPEDARGAGLDPATSALARSGRRNARRHRPGRRLPQGTDAQQPARPGANLLVLPNIDAANISYNLLKTAAGGHRDRPCAARRRQARAC